MSTVFLCVLVITLVSGVCVLWWYPSLPPSGIEGGMIDCSVIIPARNEEKNLPGLLHTIKNQSRPPREVIVVDDGSTDATAEIARSFGASVVSASDKPADWTGKTYALYTGAVQACGKYLVFCDADLSLFPHTMSRLFSTPLPSASIRSVLPWHRVKTIPEQLSLIFNLMQMAGSGAFSPASRYPSGSFGPFMLMHRQTYLDFGGHTLVKNRVLENFALGRILQDEMGFVQELYGGKNLVTFRMYPEGFADLWEGWVKGFSSGADMTKKNYLIPSIFWIGGLFSTGFIAGFVGKDISILHMVLLAAIGIHFYVAMKQAGSFWAVNILCIPLHCLFFFVLFFWSAVRKSFFKTVLWKGRRIKL
ncbi:MAG: glycosyltransferase family 2 protein [Fibrobacterota bacterium]